MVLTLPSAVACSELGVYGFFDKSLAQLGRRLPEYDEGVEELTDCPDTDEEPMFVYQMMAPPDTP